MSFEFEVEIQHLYISEGHNYFKNPVGKPGNRVTTDSERVEAVAHKGLRGDRYFGYKENFLGQVTFFSADIHQLLLKEFNPVDPSPQHYRRNIVISGIALNQLIGKTFRIGDVVFEGTEHCAPCKWMDSAFGKGALKFLHGRGGLRARILESGEIIRGRTELITQDAIDNTNPTAPLVRVKLPR